MGSTLGKPGTVHRGLYVGAAKTATGAETAKGLPMKFMLDTNICIYLIKHRPQQLRNRFDRTLAGYAGCNENFVLLTTGITGVLSFEL